MAMGYRPKAPFSVPMLLLKPTVAMVQGVKKKAFETPENGTLFFGSFRTFGGTERESNGAYTLEDTATIDTWFMPEIAADCRVHLPEVGENGKTYEIVGTPEDIDMRHQHMRIKVKAVGGKP